MQVMAQKHKGFIQFLVLFAIAMYIVLGIVTPIVNRRLSPTEAFSKFVCRPIPKSVTEIKMDRQISWLGSHRFVFHFKIDEEDLSHILESWPFKEVPKIKYTDSGRLWWEYLGPGSRQGFSLYKPTGTSPAPEWFKLQNWDSPKAYLYTVRIDTRRHRFLVYSKKLGEAYFIDYRTSGR
jgi:hypothetical protein